MFELLRIKLADWYAARQKRRAERASRRRVQAIADRFLAGQSLGEATTGGHYEPGSPTAQFITAMATRLIAESRETNDRDLTPEETAKTRGFIRACKAFQALGQPAPSPDQPQPFEWDVGDIR